MSNEATSVDAVDLANELRPVVLKITRELRRELHAIGVSASQVSLLVQIRAKSGIGISELAERERMSVPGMSGHVERLVKAGLVERTRAESGDRHTRGNRCSRFRVRHRQPPPRLRDHTVLEAQRQKEPRRAVR